MIDSKKRGSPAHNAKTVESDTLSLYPNAA